MASRDGCPHAFKDTLGAVQPALIETRLEQLHLRTLSLGDHSELKANLFAGYQTTYQPLHKRGWPCRERKWKP